MLRELIRADPVQGLEMLVGLAEGGAFATDDEEDLLKAFMNFSASTVVLKFYPQVDPTAFQNTVSLRGLNLGRVSL